jgi:antitoxin component of MazEF toxin-antitoxin module
MCNVVFHQKEVILQSNVRRCSAREIVRIIQNRNKVVIYKARPMESYVLRKDQLAMNKLSYSILLFVGVFNFPFPVFAIGSEESHGKQILTNNSFQYGLLISIDLYVFNSDKNSKMNEAGFYYSTDETKTWNKSKLEGIGGQPTALAVHPTEKGVIAIGTDSGVYVSKDYGNKFDVLIPNTNVTAISFSHDNELLVGVSNGKSILLQFDLATKKQTMMKLPSLNTTDMITYVQQNPKNKHEYIFATLEKNVYISKDNGANWSEIVDKGVSITTYNG